MTVTSYFLSFCSSVSSSVAWLTDLQCIARRVIAEICGPGAGRGGRGGGGGGRDGDSTQQVQSVMT